MSTRTTGQPLRSVSEIRRFFRTARTPVYFVSATEFNLLGIDRWVPTFRYLNYWEHSLDDFREGSRTIRLLESSAA